MKEDEVVFTLSKDEAIILFEFTSRFTDTDVLCIEDQTEQRVLWNICASLEKVLREPFDPMWKQILEQARDTVRDME